MAGATLNLEGGIGDFRKSLHGDGPSLGCQAVRGKSLSIRRRSFRRTGLVFVLGGCGKATDCYRLTQIGGSVGLPKAL